MYREGRNRSSVSGEPSRYLSCRHGADGIDVGVEVDAMPMRSIRSDDEDRLRGCCSLLATQLKSKDDVVSRLRDLARQLAGTIVGLFCMETPAPSTPPHRSMRTMFPVVSQSQYRTCYASEIVLTPSGPTTQPTDQHARLCRRYHSASAPKRQTKAGSAVLLQTMYFSTMLQSHSHPPPLTGCSELLPACPAARRHAVAASVTV